MIHVLTVAKRFNFVNMIILFLKVHDSLLLLHRVNQDKNKFNSQGIKKIFSHVNFSSVYSNINIKADTYCCCFFERLYLKININFNSSNN